MDYQTGLFEKYLVTGDWSQPKPSRGTKRRDEKQIMRKQTPHMKTQTHKQRTATEEPSWTVSKKNTGGCVCVCGGGGGGCLNQFYSR